jgi:toxin CptA
MKSAPAITFDYRPSRLLAIAIVAITVLAVMAVALAGMPWWAKPIAAAGACLYTAYALRRFWRAPSGRFAWQQAGHWRIADAAGGDERIADLEDAVVRGPWIVLRLRGADGARVALILGPDNSDADVRRRLRVHLARVGENAT